MQERSIAEVKYLMAGAFLLILTRDCLICCRLSLLSFVLVCQDCHVSFKDWVTETTKIYFLMVLDAESLRSRCQRRYFFRGLSPGVQIAVSFLSSHGLLSVPVCVPSHLTRTPVILDQGRMQDFTLLYLFRGPVSKYSHIWRYWGLELQHRNFSWAGAGGHINFIII